MHPSLHAARRTTLSASVGAPVLLLGNDARARNLPGNDLPFRQDSSFLYYTGCTLPGAAAWIEAGRSTLYLTPPAADDGLWHGHVETIDDTAARLGFDEARPYDELAARASKVRPATVAVPDAAITARAAGWIGRPLAYGADPGDEALIAAIIRQRRTKTADELDAMRTTARVSADAHRFAMAATRPGVHERTLTALFEAYLSTRGLGLAYDTILTQRGEVLHNHAHDAVCEAGKLLLLDGGGESPDGYAADITRAWPVSGRFTARQRAAYDAVLAAQAAAIDTARAGVRYRLVHDAASKVIAQFLIDERILRGVDADTAVARGAHALFFPHGVGHLIGLDVHDLRNFGDRPAYASGATRDPAFGTRYLRLDLPLETNWVVTIEPGFYVVPAILGDAALRAGFADILDMDVAAQWAGFGGIRIEDDVVIRDGQPPEILSAHAPKHPDEVCGIVGSGAPLEALLS